ncbi:MAG: response regulator [Myxococcota bacterium]
MGHKLTAVVIDDDPGVRALIARTLRSEGYHVRAFGSTEDADGPVRDELPSIMIVDKDLPGSSGVQWMARLRTDLYDLTPPSALVSGGLEDTGDSDRALFDGLLAKPFRVDALRELIRDLAAKARHRRRRSDQRLRAAVRELPSHRRSGTE